MWIETSESRRQRSPPSSIVLSFFLSNSADPRSIIIACWPGPPLPSPRRPQDDRIQGNNASNFRPIINTREGRAGRPRQRSGEKAEQRATRPSSVLNTERRGFCASYSLFGQRNELEVEEESGSVIGCRFGMRYK